MKNLSLISLILVLLSFSALGKSKILFLGDSLTEGYQLPKKDSFPSILETMFEKDNIDVEVLNGGVSGSTTSSGPSRLKWFLKAKPTHLVLALGANDGLRGFDIETTYKNLEKTIELARENEMKILLCGMQMPPNYGKEYQEKFKNIFIRLKKKYKLAFYPFLLEGVGGKAELNLGDRIHPNKKGYEVIAKKLYPVIKKELL